MDRKGSEKGMLNFVCIFRYSQYPLRFHILFLNAAVAVTCPHHTSCARSGIGSHSHVRCALCFLWLRSIVSATAATASQKTHEDSHRLTDQIQNSAGEHAGLLHAIHVQWSTVGATTPDAWWSGGLSVAWLRAGLQDKKLPFNSCQSATVRQNHQHFNCHCSRILTM